MCIYHRLLEYYAFIVLLSLTDAFVPQATCGDFSVFNSSALVDDTFLFTIEIHHPLFASTAALIPGSNYTVSLSQTSINQPVLAFRVTTAGGDIQVITQSTGDTGRALCSHDGNLEFMWTTPLSNASCLDFSISMVLYDTRSYSVNSTLCKQPGCYLYYTGDSGTVASVNYPDNYPDDFQCTFVIYSLPYKRLHLKFQMFEVEPQYRGECVDYVSISDGGTNATSFCGHKDREALDGMQFVSNTGKFELNFVTDSKINYGGFLAYYYVMSDKDCNTSLLGLEGEIRSPVFSPLVPVFCEYKIQLPSMYRVEIQLVNFSLPLSTNNPCCSDFLEISSGPNSSGKRWCGRADTWAQELRVYVSSSSIVTVSYVIDNPVQQAGFHIRYKAFIGCENETMTGANGTLSSTNFPLGYINGQQCEARFERSIPSVIELSFEVLHTESLSDLSLKGDLCALDYVEILVNNEVHRICGNWEGKERFLYFRFQTKRLLLRFVSNDQIRKRGFTLRWATWPLPNASSPCSRDFLEIGNYCYETVGEPRDWEAGKQACRAKGGMLATIEDSYTQTAIDEDLTRRFKGHLNFWIGANDRWFEGDFEWADRRATLFHNWFPGWSQYNQSGSQPSDDGLADEDCVELRREFQLPGKGVRQTDMFYWNDRRCDAKNPYICQHPRMTGVDSVTPVTCDGLFLLSRDTPYVEVTSPEYPAPYPDSTVCNLLVTAPFGYHVVVDFIHLELEDSDGCSYDNVTMSSTPASTERTLCGNWTSRLKKARWVSSTNHLILTFKTDQSVHATGYRVNISYTDLDYMCNSSKVDNREEWKRGPGGCFLLSTTNSNHGNATDFCNGRGASLLSDMPGDILFFMQSWLTSVEDAETGQDQSSEGVFFWLHATDTQRLANDSVQENLCPAVRMLRGWHDDVSVEQRTVAMEIPCTSGVRYICKKAQQEPVLVNEETLYDQRDGTITSPGFPAQYPSRYRHTYIFTSARDTRILFQIQQLHLEVQEKCLYDRLETKGMIRDRVLCQFPISNPYLLSKTNEATVLFITDESREDVGFNLTFYWINVEKPFHDQYNGTTGLLTSLNYPNVYPDVQEGCFTLSGPADTRVLLQVLDFALPEIACEESSISVHTGYLNASSLFCGKDSLDLEKQLPPIIISKYQEVTICITSPYMKAGMGFSANYTFVPATSTNYTKTFTIAPGQNLTLEPVTFREGTPSELSQLITVRTVIGHNVVLQFEEVSVTSKDNCTQDSLTVVDDSLYGRGQVLEQYTCSNESVILNRHSPVTSYLNRLTLDLESGFHVDGEAAIFFRATFMSKEDPEYLSKTQTDRGTFDQCTGSTCLNAGVCIGIRRRFMCSCTSHYTGLFCQATKCEVNPCKQGACNLTDVDPGFRCTCLPGFWGQLCAMDDTVCQYKQCSGHGWCLEGHNSSLIDCNCMPGWSGARCETPVPIPEEKLTVGQKLLKEPIWIGMIVMLNLLLFFCVSYVIRRRFGDRLASLIPKRFTTPPPSKETDSEDHRSREFCSIQLDPPSSELMAEATPPITRTRALVIRTNSIQEDLESSQTKSTVGEDVDGDRLQVAARFFESYNTTTGLKTPDVPRRPSLLPSNSATGLSGLVGGTVSFADDSMDKDMEVDDSMNMRSSHSLNDWDSIPPPGKNPRLEQRLHSFSEFSTTNEAKMVRTKVSLPRELSCPAAPHCFPEIRIINSDDREIQDTMSVRDIHTSFEDMALDNVRGVLSVEVGRDSGYPSTSGLTSSTMASSNTTQSDTSNVDLTKRRQSSPNTAAEKRKLFSAKNSKYSSSFCIVEDDSPPSSRWRSQDYPSSSQRFLGLPRDSYESDSVCSNCRRDHNISSHFIRDSRSYDGDLDRLDHFGCSYDSVQCGDCHQPDRRQRQHRGRCACNRSLDYGRRHGGSHGSLHSCSKGRSSTRHRHHKHLHPFDSSPLRNYRLRPSTSTESENFESECNSRRRRKSYRKHNADGLLSKQSKKGKEAWKESRSFDNDRRSSESKQSVRSDLKGQSDRTSKQYLDRGKASYRERGDGKRSRNKTSFSSDPDISNVQFVQYPPTSREARQLNLTEAHSQDTRESDVSTTSCPELRQPVFMKGRPSRLPLRDNYMDSAYESKQSSVDRVFTTSRDRSISIDSISTFHVRNDDRTHRYLQQAAQKLAQVERMRADRLSKDSAMNTLSEDDLTSDSSEQRRPLVKRTSGSLVLQVKEMGLSQVEEELPGLIPGQVREDLPSQGNGESPRREEIPRFENEANPTMVSEEIPGELRRDSLGQREDTPDRVTEVLVQEDEDLQEAQSRVREEALGFFSAQTTQAVGEEALSNSGRADSDPSTLACEALGATREPGVTFTLGDSIEMSEVNV